FSSIVINFDVDKEGNIWLTTIKGFSVITKDKRIFNLTDSKIYKNSFCETIKNDRYGHVWVGTREGLLVFDKKKFLQNGKLVNALWFYKGQISNDFITKIVEDKFGDIWIGTKNGILKYEFSSNKKMDKKNIHKSQFIYYLIENLFTKDIFVDIEHNIWLGTRGGGVIKIQGDVFWTYDLNDGLLNREILSIYQTKDKSIWFGTNDGVARLLNNKISTYTTKHGLPHKVVTAFQEAKNGSLLIGTWNGLALLKSNRVLNIPNKEISNNFRVFDIIKRDNKEYWLATNRGLFHFNLYIKKYKRIEKYPALINNRINSIYVQNDSLIHFIGNHDLFQLNINKDSIISLKEKYNIKSDFFTAISYSPTVGTLIGCRNGIHFVKDDSVYLHLDSKNYLIDDWVISILAVNDNQFWVGGNKGVSLITIDDKNNIFAKNYSSKNGFIGEEIITENSMFKDMNENVWFGTFLGVSKYIKEKDVINSVPPTVKIEKIRVFYKEATMKYLQNLEYDQNSISITFIGISFRDERDV
ncbi:MAG: hypothetical protein KAR38_04600, partial [Calditrichia bacterium]|nr:hypothetical protein [Calditrichia bacterium]